MDIKQAKIVLKEGYVLKAIIDARMLYFSQKDKTIIVINDSYSLSISLEDFEKLYDKYSFELVESSENDIVENKEKDLEYYSKLNKRQ